MGGDENDYGKIPKGHRRTFHLDKPYIGPFRKPELVMVHSLRRVQSIPICFHELVPDDVGLEEVRGEIIQL